MPLISIIVATFNASKTLQKCIDSIAQQSFRDFELIIIDGKSNDGTLDVISRNSEIIDYWVSEQDSGVYNAWNKGLDKATGDWICFIGADDYLWCTSALNDISFKLTTIASETYVAYGRIAVVNKLGEKLYEIGERWDILKPSFKKIMNLPHPGLMHRRSLFEVKGRFDETFKIAGDYEMLLRILIDGNAKFLGNAILVGMTHGGMSSDMPTSLLAYREVRRAQRIHGLRMPSAKWVFAISRVYIRIILWKILGETLTRKILDLGRKIRRVPPLWRNI